MKKINKIIFSIFIIVIIAISLIVFLFMFNNDPTLIDREPTLIGSWEEDSAGGIIIFRDNGTIEFMSTKEHGISGTYTVNGSIINVTLSTLTIPMLEENISWEMKYEFLSYNRIKFTYLTGETEDSIEYYQRV